MPETQEAPQSARFASRTRARSSSARDVCIQFTRKPVLEGISFTVLSGAKPLVILGPAGCGKSVLMKLVNGLLKPDSGEIWVFGQRIDTMRESDLFKFRSRIGMVFQESALFDSPFGC